MISRNRVDLLAQCNSASAGYLFQQDKFYDVSYDTGDKSVQCGRKVDAFQVWFMMKTMGEEYFSRAVENAFDQVRVHTNVILKLSILKSIVQLNDLFHLSGGLFGRTCQTTGWI